MQTHKVIFLDIDGVLNSNRTMFAFGRCGYPGSRNGFALDDTSIRMIKALCDVDETIRIVVSSSWRIGAKTQEVESFFAPHKLPIAGVTDVASSMNSTRGHEIGFWLINHPDVKDFVILDDDTDMLPEQMSHLVWVNRRDGLSFNNICDAGRILRVNHPLFQLRDQK